jgi:hypothetical protein
MIVSKQWIEELIISAGELHAKGAASFDFFRRRSQRLPPDISWDEVRAALRYMDVYEDNYPEVFARIEQHAANSTGPKRWANR